MQHGSAYMHPQARPALNRNTTTLMRDKITEQQKAGGLFPLQDQQSNRNQQTKSFAKYLNTMLENQARQSTEAAEIYQPGQNTNESHYSNQSKQNGAFSSQGKGSALSIGNAMRQPEYRPVLAKE